MALKYFFEYYDLENILHRVEIDDPDYVGSSIEVNGYCSLDNGSVENPLECIRGRGLKVYLDANTDLTFSDLYSENERNFEVTYIRDSVTLFIGYLNPEGLFEDYVTDKWTISLDCSDGLSFLKNLSYVDDTTGLFFSGKQKEITIIANCLKRTGIDLNIYTSIGITYTNQDVGTDVLNETFLNADRFRKDDNGNTVMNCDEVLKSVLEKYNACVTQYDNTWYIYRPNELFADSEAYFYSYNSSGTSITNAGDIELGQTIGSAINGFYPHWSGGNQQKSIKNSVGAYRINYKYGFVKSFLDNIFLISSSGAFDDYTVNDATYLTIPASEQGIELDCIDDGGTKTLTSDTISLTAGDNLRFLTKFTTELESDCSFAIFSIKLVGASTYYLQSDGQWATSGSELRLYNGQVAAGATPPEQPRVGTGSEIEYVINSDDLPINGDVSIEIYTGGIFLTGGDANGSVFISEVSLDPIDVSENEIQGENHTFQRVSNPSSKIENTKEIFNGDNPSDLYVGTIYEDDEVTPTETWKRPGITETKPILRIMGEETLNMFQNPSIIFKGDIYGYIPYLSVVSIDGLSGVFMPIEYSYDTKFNITTLKLIQIFGTDLGSDIEYDLKYDYGNVVQPTIKG